MLLIFIMLTMDVRVERSESAETAQQSTVTKQPQLYSSHSQHLSFPISVTATFLRRQILPLNTLRIFFGTAGEASLMNGLPAHVFFSYSYVAGVCVCVCGDCPRRLSRRGEKYSCVFLTSRWFLLTNLLFVSNCA